MIIMSLFVIMFKNFKKHVTLSGNQICNQSSINMKMKETVQSLREKY